MALPFSEDFTGTNGDSWDATNWPTTSSEGTVNTDIDIQSNQGHFKAGTAQDDFVSMNASSDTSVVDSEGSIYIDPGATGSGNEWLYICLRSTGEQVASNAGRPATAYYFRFLVNGSSTQSILYRRLSNSEQQLDGDILAGHSNADRNAGEPFWLKWEIEDDASVSGDTDIRWKIWDADDSEPASWESYTDANPGALYDTAGILQLVARNYSTGGNVEAHVDDISFDILGGTAGQTISIGQVTETDTAQTITPDKPITEAVGQSTETDTAQTVTPLKPITTAVGQATETDSAQAVTADKPQTVAVGQTTETDSAQAIAAVKPGGAAVGQAEETDSALAITVVKPVSVAIGQVTETDTAQAISPVSAGQFVSVGQAEETDTAQAMSVVLPVVQFVNVAYETDVAQPITVIAIGIPSAYDANEISKLCRVYRLPTSNRIVFVTSLGRGAHEGVRDWDVVSPLMRVNNDQIQEAKEYTESIALANKTEATSVIYAAVEAAVSGIYPAE